MPAALKPPFQKLQDLTQNLHLPFDDLLLEMDAALQQFKSPAFMTPDMGMKFPDDLLTTFDPVDIMKELGGMIPSPLDKVYGKAMELA